jgi:antirestriction protein ArdC
VCALRVSQLARGDIEMPSAHPNPAETITQAIVERLEAGTRPWVKPWTGAPLSRPLRACGTPYRGINVFWLWMAAEARGFSSPYWMTYARAQSEGGQVRKGERGTLAIFYKTYSAVVDGQRSDEPHDETRRVLKSYTVFNASQIDGLPDSYQPQAVPQQDPEPDPRAVAFFASVPANLRHSGAEAYYEPGIDRVTMPLPAMFRDTHHYHATLAHELIHWTGHPRRLARDLKNRFGSDAYAMEELIAELGAALVGADLGLPVAHLDHHASYIASWLKVLRSDSRAVLAAAARAEEAARMLRGFQVPAALPNRILELAA